MHEKETEVNREQVRGRARASGTANSRHRALTLDEHEARIRAHRERIAQETPEEREAWIRTWREREERRERREREASEEREVRGTANGGHRITLDEREARVRANRERIAQETPEEREAWVRRWRERREQREQCEREMRLRTLEDFYGFKIDRDRGDNGVIYTIHRPGEDEPRKEGPVDKD